MENDELKKQVLEILNAQAKNDSKLSNVWTGKAESIETVDLKSVRLMKLEVEDRKREKRSESSPASRPEDAQDTPERIDEWKCHPKWLPVGWANESDWEDVCEYWTKCIECNGAGADMCFACHGKGLLTCPHCDGNGKV